IILVIAPKLFLSAPPMHWKEQVPIDSIHYLIQQYKRSGFDFIKILSVPSEAFYEATMAESRLAGLPVVGHIPNRNLHLALSKNQRSIEHLQGYTDYFKAKQFDALQNVIQITAEKGIYNCPTLDWYFVGSLHYSLESLKHRAGMAYISPALKQEWEKKILEYTKEQNSNQVSKKEDSLGLVAMRNVMEKLKLKGCKLLLSPDASSVFQVPGFGLVEEMKIFKELGFTNYEILRMASLGSAEYFGEDNWGKVREGHEANLVLLSQNPLENIENLLKVKGVILNGKWLSQSIVLEKIRQSK
ncbi:MAG: amidohydrolase family protein, partial [Cyclobacteriaceae bacterium]|nr:amidohydrolase family protein [Cyclobacteriaceae bacterium]